MDFTHRHEALSPDRALELWHAYQGTGDPSLRDGLVLAFAPVVKHVVYRTVGALPAGCDIDELISCGLEALIRSIDRYDPDGGLTLQQATWRQVHAAVLDALQNRRQPALAPA